MIVCVCCMLTVSSFPVFISSRFFCYSSTHSYCVKQERFVGAGEGPGDDPG